MSENTSPHIVVICTGNICRSPMAEGLLRERLNGCDAVVSSAGTHARDGDPASYYGVEILAGQGIDISGHRSRYLTDELAEDADCILGMERMHIDFVRRFCRTQPEHLYLLAGFGRDAAGARNVEIDDPVGGDREAYLRIYMRISAEIDRILPDLKTTLGIECDNDRT